MGWKSISPKVRVEVSSDVVIAIDGLTLAKISIQFQRSDGLVKSEERLMLEKTLQAKKSLDCNRYLM